VLHADALADYIENDLGGIIPEEYSDPYGNGRIKMSDGTANEDEKEQEEKPVPEPQPLQPSAAVESSGSVSIVIPGRAAITKNVIPTSGNAAQSVADTSSASAANAAPTAAVPANGGENPATGAAVSSAMIFFKFSSVILNAEDGIDKVAGPALGAVPIATAVSLESKTPLLMIRKEKKGYGTSKLIEGELNSGDNVIVVEDVTTTGGSLLKAIKAIQENGGNVTRAFVVVDRQEGAVDAFEKEGIKLEPLITVDEF
jgi:orotate phosphoribosyltransferase